MMSLPVVDLKATGAIEALSGRLMEIGRGPGFFYLVGHDIPLELTETVFSISKNLFKHLSDGEKCHFAGTSGEPGYSGPGKEKLSGLGRGDLKESYHFKTLTAFPDADMPVTLQESREHLRSFSAECERVGHALLQAFSIGLGLPKQFLSKSHTGEQNRFRMLHYPPVTAAAQSKGDILVAEDEDIRAGAHSDYGSLTLLFQEPSDAGGLQVWYNSAWLNVPYVEKAIVVNIGDALEFWTAGRLRSTIHRVTFPASKGPAGSRYSIPFFMTPDDDAILEPLLSSEERQLSDAGQEFNFGELAKVKGYQSLEPVSAKEHRLRREANIGSSKKAYS